MTVGRQPTGMQNDVKYKGELWTSLVCVGSVTFVFGTYRQLSLMVYTGSLVPTWSDSHTLITTQHIYMDLLSQLNPCCWRMWICSVLVWTHSKPHTTLHYDTRTGTDWKRSMSCWTKNTLRRSLYSAHAKMQWGRRCTQQILRDKRKWMFSV